MAPPPREHLRSSRKNNRKAAAGASSSAAASSTASAPSIFAEARKLKQQAERKAEGRARDPLLTKSAQLFQNALELGLGLSNSDQGEALFDLGEVLLLSSGSIRAEVPSTTGSPFEAKVTKLLALNIQLEAFIAGADLCRQSHEVFEKVCSMEGESDLLEAAAVNSGNALCDWAELALEIPTERGGGAVLAKEIYRRAFDRYDAALRSSPDDVELLTNLGDCCIQMAELAASSAQVDASRLLLGWDSTMEIYNRGLEAYALACSKADTRIGDDLAGLLQNWGVGLCSVAARSPYPEQAMTLVKTAMEKLHSAMTFRRPDSGLCLALGEGLVGVAEHLAGNPHYGQQVYDLLEKAVADGFGAALKIDSRNVNTLLGLGDAHLAAAKLFIGNAFHPQAAKHLEESAKAYVLAVNILKEEREPSLTFGEQCDALYNLACAAALAGQEPEVQAALVQLDRVKALSVKDIMEDPDLTGVRSKEWFTFMVQQIQQQFNF